MTTYINSFILLDPSSMEDADIKRAVSAIKKLFTKKKNAGVMSLAETTSLSKTMSALFAALNQDSPGGKAMSMADKKTAMLDAFMSKKGLNLAAVSGKCKDAACDGSTDIFAGDSAVLKKQKIKKI